MRRARLNRTRTQSFRAWVRRRAGLGFSGFRVSEGIPKRSALVALLVGTLLNLINQGDALLRGAHLDLKIALTYAVPYCVATYGAVSYRLRLDAS
jgi:hypothetical protein